MKKNVLSNTAKATLNVLFYMTIVFLLIFSIANIRVKKENDIAHVFGTGFLSVQSDSMAGSEETSFEKGDLIFVNMINESNLNSVKVGDVVTFYDYSIKAFNTHRIVDTLFVNNEMYFITQGDNVSEPDDKPLHPNDVLAVYKSAVPKLGSTLDYLQTSSGFALMIILPVLIILIVEGILLVKNIMTAHKIKIEANFKAIEQKAMSELEQEKERIRQQILKELQLNK
ncbi:MAG: signal peptidase I [Tenericutes bacterium HGW-Tenericutes-6]|jgi:signal peptidase|nr:MAG: signal peptidase I [Tenericutes bacterium HGW-Tenericutes-6]